MSTAKQGDKVHVHYTGTLADGSEFDSSSGGAPLSFVVGGGELLAAFETAIVGMTPGEKKTISIPVHEAYGEHEPALVHEIGRDQIPAEVELAVGSRLQAQTPEGDTVVLTVVGLSDDSVTVDGNHPLAGEDLTFVLELVQIDD